MNVKVSGINMLPSNKETNKKMDTHIMVEFILWGNHFRGTPFFQIKSRMSRASVALLFLLCQYFLKFNMLPEDLMKI